MKVFLNPGHDELELKGTPDYDPGAVNAEMGLYENEIAAAVGALVEKRLLAAGIEVKTLQSESLSGICAAANEWGADVFVSIHCNAFNGIAEGTETLTYPDDTEGHELAACIQRRVTDAFCTIDRGVKNRDNLAVLNGTDMPAVLVEIAFIDNPGDAALLRDRQDDFARAIANGILDYKGMKALDEKETEWEDDMMEGQKRYNTLAEMPEWAKPTIEKMIGKKMLSGDGQGLDLSHDMIRVFVIHDRAGLYD